MRGGVNSRIELLPPVRRGPSPVAPLPGRCPGLSCSRGCNRNLCSRRSSSHRHHRRGWCCRDNGRLCCRCLRVHDIAVSEPRHGWACLYDSASGESGPTASFDSQVVRSFQVCVSPVLTVAADGDGGSRMRGLGRGVGEVRGGRRLPAVIDGLRRKTGSEERSSGLRLLVWPRPSPPAQGLDRPAVHVGGAPPYTSAAPRRKLRRPVRRTAGPNRHAPALPCRSRSPRLSRRGCHLGTLVTAAAARWARQDGAAARARHCQAAGTHAVIRMWQRRSLPSH